MEANRSMLPCYQPLTACLLRINFVVHDLTKNLEDRVRVEGKHEEAQDYLLNYTYYDMIQLLMSLITDSESFKLERVLSNPKQSTRGAHTSSPEMSYIGFIGTHYDRIQNDLKKLHEFNEKLKNLTDKVENLHILPSGSGVVHPIDNSREHAEVQNIREQVQQVIDVMEDQELPITWMILELEIQEWRMKGNKSITYNQYKEISRKCFIEGDDEVEVSLRYFHVLGIVLCFRDSEFSELHNLVIIDLQWLFTNLARMMMHLSEKDFKSITNYKLKNRFEEQKLLAKQILENI